MKKKVTVVVDSGIGGLTFLDEVITLKKGGNYVYLADTLNAPYGNKSVGFIQGELLKWINCLDVEYEIEKLIFACNTAAISAQSLIAQKVNYPVISVVDVTVEYFKQLKNADIDWLATETTINTHYLKENLPSLNVSEVACKKFVTLIESREYRNANLREKVVIETLFEKGWNPNADYVILGCTHYPYLSNEIASVYSENTKIFNPSVELAKTIERKFEDIKVEFIQTGDSVFFDEYVSGKYDGKVKRLKMMGVD